MSILLCLVLILGLVEIPRDTHTQWMVNFNHLWGQFFYSYNRYIKSLNLFTQIALFHNYFPLAVSSPNNVHELISQSNQNPFV